MTRQDIFAIACDLAAQYHEGQKYGDEDYYSYHLLGVSATAPNYAPPWLDTLEVQTVGVLHDILEDTECTAEILLSKGIPDFIVEAVILLTKNIEDDYDKRYYIPNICQNPLSRAVKKADAMFNLTNSVIACNRHRVNKYTTYLRDLT